MREFTVWTTWSGPTARLLSDGLRSAALPCGPSNPTPSPSKLATSVAGGRVPGAVCSSPTCAGCAVTKAARPKSAAIAGLKPCATFFLLKAKSRRVGRLIQADLAAARHLDRRPKTPVLRFDFGADDMLLGEIRHRGLQIVAHQVDQRARHHVAGMALRELAVAGM